MATEPVIVDELVIELWQTVALVLADNLYLVLGTADAAGKPWVSPVFFAARDENLLYWVSSPAADIPATSTCSPPSPSPSSTLAPPSE